MKLATYGTDLIDAQWPLLRRFLSAAKNADAHAPAAPPAPRQGCGWRLASTRNPPPPASTVRPRAPVP